MKALYICKDLLDWIKDGNKKASIHSVFKNSVNILGDDNRFISVVGGDKPISPNGIKIGGKIDFNSLGICQGEIGRFSREGFFSKNLYIDYKNSREWSKEPIFSYEKIDLKGLKEKIKLLEQFLLHEGNTNGILRFLPKLADRFNLKSNLSDLNIELEKTDLFIIDRFFDYISSFKEYDIEGINEKARKIIGFGPGLTPSMDDFISGMMIANVYLTEYKGRDIKNALALNKETVKNIEDRTTRVSEEMLRFSSKGEPNEDIRNMIIGLLSTMKKEDLNNLYKKVASIGDSSGTDILSGVYIGSLILLSK